MWLKTVGQAILKGLHVISSPQAQQVVQIGETVASAFIPGAAPVIDTINLIGGVVLNTEVAIESINEAGGATGLLTGEAKLRAAAPLVEQVILGSQLMSGKSVANPEAFKAAINKITSGVADLLNSLQAK